MYVLNVGMLDVVHGEMASKRHLCYGCISLEDGCALYFETKSPYCNRLELDDLFGPSEYIKVSSTCICCHDLPYSQRLKHYPDTFLVSLHCFMGTPFLQFT
jgi:hypothetical protein